MTDKSVRRLNIAAPEFKQSTESPEGFRPGSLRLGKLMGQPRPG
jgi:hypothetical protein